MTRELKVSVRRVGSSPLDVLVAKGCSVIDVVHAVEAALKVPPKSLVLFCGAAVLSQRHIDACGESDSLLLTMHTVGKVGSSVNLASCGKMFALHLLESLDQSSSAVACSLLEHEDDGVRRKALSALERFLDKDDARVGAAVCKRLVDSRRSVSEAALQALKDFPLKFMGSLLLAVRKLLLHEKATHRRQALRALPFLSAHLNDDDIVSVCRLSEDAPVGVRVTALETLPHVVGKLGDLRAIRSVCRRFGDLDDPSTNVWSAALSALPKVAAKGDERALALVLPYLEHPWRFVRIAALRTLPHLLCESLLEQNSMLDKQGDLTILVGSCALPSCHSHVRLAAADALCCLAALGDGCAQAVDAPDPGPDVCSLAVIDDVSYSLELNAFLSFHRRRQEQARPGAFEAGASYSSASAGGAAPSASEPAEGESDSGAPCSVS
eukprot:TRINITY_DN25787_c0_g1_i1.p1 TRINITY_DN25787_c0_g1~~TRINITY_DN25787_c0_g1_i1.p1  ORF type:complete len:461 (+),score=75.97 TRINITY_DN25787_c0_g1_i1:70-1383(+)